MKRDFQKLKEAIPHFSVVKEGSSFCSDDPPEGLSHYARDIFKYTTLDPLQQDLLHTPLETIAHRVVRDAYLVGVRAAELCARTSHYTQVMQGKQPQEWFETWKQEKDTMNSEFTWALAGMQAEKEKLEKASASKDEKIQQLTEALAGKERELKGKENELKECQGKIGEISETNLRAFLSSRAFEAAVLATAGVEMRRVLHGAIGALGFHWPVEPKEFGINPVPEDETAPDLKDFRWDRVNDRLVASDGAILEPPSVCPELSTFEHVKPKHPWSPEYFPLEDDHHRLEEVILVGEKAQAEEALKKKRKRGE